MAVSGGAVLQDALNYGNNNFARFQLSQLPSSKVLFSGIKKFSPRTGLTTGLLRVDIWWGDRRQDGSSACPTVQVMLIIGWVSLVFIG